MTKDKIAAVSTAERVKTESVEVLADNWGILKNTRFRFLRSDGQWQAQTRETYDRGHGAAILLYNIARNSVILTRQFRLPCFVSGHDGMLLEVPAGKLDGLSPEDCIRAETEQETGYRAGNVKKVFQAYMSPGSVTECIHCFVAPYEPGDRVAHGGGLAHEGEDIEVLETGFDAAMDMIAHGEIQDGKTIMLLQHAALHIFKRD